MKIPVDGLRQADLIRQQMHHPDAAAGDGTVTIDPFIPDVARPESRRAGTAGWPSVCGPGDPGCDACAGPVSDVFFVSLE